MIDLRPSVWGLAVEPNERAGAGRQGVCCHSCLVCTSVFACAPAARLSAQSVLGVHGCARRRPCKAATLRWPQSLRLSAQPICKVLMRWAAEQSAAWPRPCHAPCHGCPATWLALPNQQAARAEAGFLPFLPKDNQTWQAQEVLALLNEDLSRLLKLPASEFWRVVQVGQGDEAGEVARPCGTFAPCLLPPRPQGSAPRTTPRSRKARSAASGAPSCVAQEDNSLHVFLDSYLHHKRYACVLGRRTVRETW